MSTNTVHASETPESAALRRFVLLGVAALILSGLLAALLVIARTPLFATLVTDPDFFRRCLVVHVDLSLVVWIYSFAAALSFLLPRAGKSSAASRVAFAVSGSGVLLVLLAAGAHGARPVLANYVPVIDHPLFIVGLAVFALGIAMSFVDRRLWPSEPAPGAIIPVPAAAVPGLRALGVALVLALLTFAASWLHPPVGLDVSTRYELGNWGGGHVLQLASTAAMLSTWLILLGGVLGRAPVSRRFAAVGFGVLVLPWTISPLLAARGMQDVGAREAFTMLMRWAIFPAVLAFVVGCSLAVVRGFRERRLDRKSLSDPRLVGFVASAFLTLLGFGLGALIRGSTTTIPAHYHAAIGAVTVSFMAIAYPLLEAVGVEVRASRFARRASSWQPALFAIGQSIFAIGFACAGVHGTARKVYGAEQHVRSLGERIGLGVMGIGGLVAIASGVIFLSVVTSAFVRRERARLRASSLGLIAEQRGQTHG